MFRVARLSVTPVKSTALHHPGRIHVGPHGVAENRRFFLVDAHGRLINGSRHPELVQVRAVYKPEREQLALRFPDGSVAAGSAVTVGEPISVDFWGRPTGGRVLDGPWTSPLSAFLGEPVHLVRAGEDSGGTDDHALTFISTGSVRELARHAGRDAVDPRRFRMLLELEGPGPHEEDTWTGRLVRVGTAIARIEGPVPRCVVTQQHPDTGARDLEVLKVIDGYRGRGADGALDFGVYGDVEEPGTIAVGDEVTLLPST